MTAVHSRTVCNDAMRSLCYTFKLPTYADGTNAPVVFRQWLDKGVPKQRAIEARNKGSGKRSTQRSDQRGGEDDDDRLRKEYLRARLSKETSGTHSGQGYSKSAMQAMSPTTHALCCLHESEEALDVITQKKNILREEGNYAAHNLNSLDQFALQLEQPEGQTHMSEVSIKGLQVLVQFCKEFQNKFPLEKPPAGSTLWTSESDTVLPAATPSSSSSLPSASPPASVPPASVAPASVPPASVPPASVPAFHGKAHASRPKGSGAAKRKKRAGKGERGGEA